MTNNKLGARLVRFSAFVGSCCLVFVQAGCLKKAPTQEAVRGMYAGKYPSGEVEVWELMPDRQFHQTLYRSLTDFRLGLSPRFEHKAKWWLANDGLHIQSNLEFCERSNPRKGFLQTPEMKKYGSPVAWLREGYASAKPIIVLSSDTGLILEQLPDKQSPVRDLGWK